MEIAVTALYGCGQTVAPPDWYTKGTPRPYRLYYVISGRAYYSVGGESTELCKDHFYLFPSSMPFNVTQDGEDRLNHLYYDFMMTPSVVTGEPLVCSLEDHPLIPPLLGLMRKSVCSYRYEGKTELRGTVISLLEAFLSLLLEIVPTNKNMDTDILAAIEYIEENYREEISVKGIAALVHLDEDYFIRKFKKYLGITPYAYIRNLRLAVARELRYSGETLKKASASVGFRYPSSYCRANAKRDDGKTKGNENLLKMEHTERTHRRTSR
ncbi:MAG: helix-turn-helix domain-containing protein [Clostridia bacterium]|nr:helix-turn-helix domain-containing protein [Clostridia bacterium]